jgi:hypothetical protein
MVTPPTRRTTHVGIVVIYTDKPGKPFGQRLPNRQAFLLKSLLQGASLVS